MRMPVFAWTTLVTSFLIIFAFPSITVALLLLMFDRLFGTNFFEVAAGGDVVLWQHLFWIFGHPEVYILILPAMGIVSEVLPTFSRKPLFGYSVMVFSTILIGFLGFAVWSHHMFTVGPGPGGQLRLRADDHGHRDSHGRQDLQLDLARLWGGSIRFTTPMLFALGLPLDVHDRRPQRRHALRGTGRRPAADTYFVVAHFHYVLIGGSSSGSSPGSTTGSRRSPGG